MFQFNVMMYFIVLGITFYYRNLILALSWIVFGLLSVVGFFVYKKIKKDNIKKEINGKKQK